MELDRLLQTLHQLSSLLEKEKELIVARNLDDYEALVETKKKIVAEVLGQKEGVEEFFLAEFKIKVEKISDLLDFHEIPSELRLKIVQVVKVFKHVQQEVRVNQLLLSKCLAFNQKNIQFWAEVREQLSQIYTPSGKSTQRAPVRILAEA